MATYLEIFDLRSNSALRNRIAVACVVAAEAIRNESGATTNHANRMIWAKAVFANPESEAVRMLMALLAQNKDATVGQITGVTDANLQTGVNAAVDVFATGS